MAQKFIVVDVTNGTDAAGVVNDNFTELYAIELKCEWYEEITSGTAGTLTPPSGSTILLNEWADGVDALASKSAGAGDLPTFETPVTSGGTAITATLAANGDWTLSGTPSSYPVCIIYVYKVTAVLYDDTLSLVTTNINEADVSAAANMTDNTLIKGDGGLKGVQDTGITADDNNGVLGAGTVVENVAGAFSAFDLTDAGRTFIATGTTATWTFPANASIAYPIGTVINGVNNGSGLLTIALTTDTLDSAGSLVDVSVDGAFTMVKTAATAWTLAGGLE